MENQVKEAKQMVEESDIKYDEVARKLAMVRTFIYLLKKKESRKINVQKCKFIHVLPFSSRLRETCRGLRSAPMPENPRLWTWRRN
jgi:hypothetical protein